MSGRGLIPLMSISMDGFTGHPEATIDRVYSSTGRDQGDQRHRRTLEKAPETEGESRWQS
jgi:hypothetical protein